MIEQRHNQFLLMDGEEDFSSRSDSFAWDESRNGFGLVQRQLLRISRPGLNTALKAWRKSAAVARDPFGYLARISGDGKSVEFSSSWKDGAWRVLEDELLSPVTAPIGTFTDLHIGGDGRLALPYSDGTQHGLLVFHLRRRWQDHTALDHKAERAWVDSENRVWAASGEKLTLCQGEPLPYPYEPKKERFEPVASNPHPLRVIWTIDIWDGSPESTPEQLEDYRNGAADSPILALCADARNLYLLSWFRTADRRGYKQKLLLRPLSGNRQSPFETFNVIGKVPFATDLGIVAAGRLALQIPWKEKSHRADFKLRDCPVVRLRRRQGEEEENQVELIHERYPQATQQSARFVSSTDNKLRYLSDNGPLGLHPLPLPRYPAMPGDGWIETIIIKPLDSEQLDTHWRRLYLEACIPSGCDLRISIRTLDDLQQPYEERHFHTQHVPLWLKQPSELPFDQGRLEPKPGEQGLFEILLQRENGQVRELRGRFLQLKIAMRSDGRHTPGIHAIRAYMHPLSWQEAWLPPHFHQQQEVDVAGETPVCTPANGADFRQRLLASLEGLLTPVEEQIINTETLVLPYAAPPQALPAIASLMGVELPPHWPDQRQRRWLTSLGLLQRLKGTAAGVALALDIATDGEVAKGRIVPVENYRLRRTRTTLLGIDMDDSDHPLTLGTSSSGNSIVGDTLFLSEDEAWQFLTLLAPEIAESDETLSKKVEQFFDQYGHRITVLLHGEARELKQTVIKVMREQMPAHVQWTIKETDHPFVLGLSPLLGIDTYLELEPEPSRVRLNKSHIGRGDLIRNPVAFSPVDVEILPQPENNGAQT